jgi:hypothetical protein
MNSRYQNVAIPLRPVEHAALKSLALLTGVPISTMVRRALAASYGPALRALVARQLLPPQFSTPNSLIVPYPPPLQPLSPKEPSDV